MRILIAAFFIMNPNPMLGPNEDWAPLTREYQVCEETATETYFKYVVCTSGALDRALHPTYKA